MSVADWVILLFLAGCAAGAVRYIRLHGGCSSCSGCARRGECQKKEKK